MTISEKGEAEVKKNKEWAFIELGKLFPSHAEMHDFPDDITVMKCELLNKVYDILSQLDEPETLSSDWIEGKKMWTRNKIPFHMDVDYAVPVDDLQNLLVPKQKLPVIPKFVAEWIEEMKQDEHPLYSVMSSLMNKTNHEWVVWEIANKNFSEIVAQAWLDGYEVEEEREYYAKIKGHENIDSDDKYWNYCVTDGTLDIGDNKVHDDVLYEYVLSATKYDWNILGINDDNADFVEVEELEE